MVCKRSVAAFLTLAMVLVAAEARAGGGSVEADGDLNLNVTFRFIPAQTDIDRVQGQVRRASRMLCDATEGRMRIRKARLTAGGAGEPAGDVWYYGPGALPRSSSSGGPVHNEGNRIHLGYENIRADVLTHELGHLVLSLGDQYDEQRRFGGPCGIGPSFDAGATDEVNHTIMQQSDYQRCMDGGGAFIGDSCYEDADCPAGHTCPLSPLMSEFSVAGNFDVLRGDSVLAANTCPAPVPGDRLTLRGPLYTGAAVAAFDGTDFSTAEASAAGFRKVEFVDSLGNIPVFGEGSSIPLSIFAEHTGSHTWTLHFGMDEGRKTGGTEGDLLILDTVDLEFSAGGALERVDGVLLTDPAYTDPVVSITDLANGATDADLAVRFDGLVEQGGTDIWWLWNSEVTAGGLAQLGNCTATAACEKRWNTATRRWEASAVADWALQNGQTPLSDWEWIVANVNNLYALTWPLPAGLPVAPSPAACANAGDVDFEVAVSGADQVAVVIDRSGSMAQDRNYLGDVRTRLDWAKAGARAFADMQAGSGMAVSLISFDDVVENELALAKIELDAVATAADHKLTDYKTEIDALTPRNFTAIGDALFAAKQQLLAAGAGGKAVLLLTDGENNAGTRDPQTVSQEMRDEGIQVFAVPVGTAADGEFLARMAAETGGTVLGSEEGLELPMVFIELYARLRGEVPALGRTPSAVRGKRTPVPSIAVTEPAPAAAGGGALPEQETFEIPVELGAQRLNVVLSGRNALPGSWNPAFRLEGPGGEIFDHLSPGVLGDEFYRILRVPSPARGIWRLTVASWTGADQFSYLLGHVEGPGPDCYAGASPRVVPEGASQVLLAASSSLGAPLGRGVGYEAVVERPAGAAVAVPLALDERQVSVRGTFSSFAGRGLYEAVVECRVTGDSRYSPGEHATPEDLLGQPRPEPFVRQSRTSFFVDAAELPPLGPGGDHDHDGIPDPVEGSVDTDGDGLPDAYDQDADGDDLPDSKEGDGDPGRDTDGDGMVDFRDPDADNDGVRDGGDPDPFQPGAASGKGSGKGRWRASLHLGSAHPLSKIDRVADANIYVQGDLGYRLLDRADLKARLGFAQFTAEAASGIDHPHWLHASLNLQVFLPPVSGLTPFVQAGPGWYRGKGSGTDAGLNAGLGLRLPGAGSTRWELGADYHLIDGRTRFFTIHLGVLFP